MLRKLRFFLGTYHLLDTVLITVIATIAIDSYQIYVLGNWLLGIVTIIIGMILAWKEISAIGQGRLNINILGIISLFMSIILGNFWVGIGIAGALSLNIAIEDILLRRRRPLHSVNTAKNAHIVRKRKLVDIPISHIQAGDKLQILPGENIPVDCQIVEGTSRIDSPFHVIPTDTYEATVGSIVLAGATNSGDAMLVARATATSENSLHAYAMRILRGTQKDRSLFAQKTDRYNIAFTIIALAGAIFMWILTAKSSSFLDVLVVATPIPIISTTTLALASGLKRASERGIFFKTSSTIEKSASIQSIGFDPMAIQPNTPLRIERVVPLSPDVDEQAILRLATALVKNDRLFPFAQPIITYADKNKLKIPKIKSVTVHEDGIVGQMGHQPVAIGPYAFVKNNLADTDDIAQKLPETRTLVVASGNNINGLIVFGDETWDTVRPTIHEIRKIGIKHPFLLTAFHDTAAVKISKQLGIRSIRSDALLSDKLKFLETFWARPSAYIGTRAEDAPVLVVSDIGISLVTTFDTLLIDSSDIFIMSSNISRVAETLEIARDVQAAEKYSLAIGMLLVFGLMAMFATGKIPLLWGILMQEFVAIASYMYAAQLRRGRQRPVRQQHHRKPVTHHSDARA